MSEGYTEHPQDTTGDGERVPREVLFARDAVLRMKTFPDLQVRLTRLLGPGPERDMLHQMCYWFSRPGMANRWTMYKTFDEWRDERGLNRKQVNKARKRLAPTRIITEKKGPYKRVHYSIDWVRLQRVLEGVERLYPLKGGQSMTVSPKGGSVGNASPKGGSVGNASPKGGSVEKDPPSLGHTPDRHGENSANGGGQTNTRDYPLASAIKEGKKVLPLSSAFQAGADGLSDRLAPTTSGEKEREVEPSFGAPDRWLIDDIKAFLGEDDEASKLLERHRLGRLDGVAVLQVVARHFHPGWLSEDLRRHASAAMRDVLAGEGLGEVVTPREASTMSRGKTG